MSIHFTAPTRSQIFKLFSFATLPVPFLVYCVLLFRSAITEFGTTSLLLDDAFIHLEFAKNLAFGQGFSFNPYQPVAGSTAPLFTVWLSLWYKFTDHYYLISYLTGIFSAIITIYVAVAITYFFTKNKLWSLGTGLIISLNPWLAWAALSGMEITFGSMFFLLAILTFLNLRTNKNWTKYIPLLLLGLVPLIRPEAYALLAFFICIYITQAYKQYSPNYARITDESSVAILLPLLVVLPYLAFSYTTTGQIFPNTYAAKVGFFGVLGSLNRTHSLWAATYQTIFYMFGYIRMFFIHLGLIDFLSLLYFVPLGIVAFIQRKRVNELLLIFMGIVVFILAVGAVVPFDLVSYPWFRHFQFLVPLMSLLTFVTIYFLIKRFYTYRFILLAIPFCVFLFQIIVSYGYVSYLYKAKVGSLIGDHITAALWLKENVSPQDVIAASDIGVVGFYLDNEIIDTEGLVNPDIRKHPYRKNSPVKDQQVYELLHQTKPQYLFKYHSVYPSLPKHEFPPLHSFNMMAIYQTPWTHEKPQVNNRTTHD